MIPELCGRIKSERQLTFAEYESLLGFVKRARLKAVTCRNLFTVSLRRAPQQERARQRLDAILDAAAEVFAEVGFDAATTNAIAARAQTSIGSLYQFFPDKTAVFRALDARYREQCRRLSVAAFSPEKADLPLDEMIRSLVDAFAGFYFQPGYRAVIEASQRFPGLCDDEKSLDGEIKRQLTALLAQRYPHLDAEHCALMAKVSKSATGSLLALAVQAEGEDRRRLIEEIKSLLSGYLRPHEAPPGSC